MRVLVLGGEGMLGHKMVQILTRRFPDIFCTFVGCPPGPRCQFAELYRGVQVLGDVDAMDLESLGSLVKSLRPKTIINCIGVVKQRDEATCHIPSITLNALLPHRLAECVGSWGGRLIHFSTDCVFSGRTGPYSEDAPSDAEDLYGKSKYLGEVASEHALTLRTSIIGRELDHFRSLLEWFLSQRGGKVRGFTRVIYSGVTTNHLAGLVGDLIDGFPDLAGLYHVASPAISKFDLLCGLKRAYGVDVVVQPDDEIVCDRSLIDDRFRKATGLPVPEWPLLLHELATDPTPYGRWKDDDRARIDETRQGSS